MYIQRKVEYYADFLINDFYLYIFVINLQTIELKKKCMKLWFGNKSNNTDFTWWYPVLTSLMLVVARSSRQGWRRAAKRTPSLCITLLTLSSPRISSQLTEDTQTDQDTELSRWDSWHSMMQDMRWDRWYDVWYNSSDSLTHGIWHISSNTFEFPTSLRHKPSTTDWVTTRDAFVSRS